MDSDLYQNSQKQQMNSGLARYQSAPTSYFSNFMADVEAFVNPPRPLSPQTDRILEQLFSDTSTSHGDIQQNNNPFMKQEREEIQMIYRSPAAQLQLPNEDSLGAAIGNSYGMMNTGRVNNVPQMKMDADIGNITAQDGSSSSNLIRHRSSPAGLFSQLNIDNGFLDTISEIVNKNVEQITPTFGELGGDDIGNYMTGFPVGSWDDTATSSDGFSVKRTRDDTSVDGGDGNDFSGSNASDSQQREFSGNRFPAAVLSHHLSLPKSSTEMMSAMENFMQFQDSSVSCKLRAKRGCATHPRSIAERVRRTRISERMRKLQELVPNMDKQTNTADMLDLAVDYIKDLQTQVRILMVNQEQCTCSDI